MDFDHRWYHKEAWVESWFDVTSMLSFPWENPSVIPLSIPLTFHVKGFLHVATKGTGWGNTSSRWFVKVSTSFLRFNLGWSGRVWCWRTTPWMELDYLRMVQQIFKVQKSLKLDATSFANGWVSSILVDDRLGLDLKLFSNRNSSQYVSSILWQIYFQCSNTCCTCLSVNGVLDVLGLF